MTSCISELFDYSERRLRAALKKIPKGTYKFADAMDDDGITDKPLQIKVEVKVTHNSKPSVYFDFSGTASQAMGGINMVWSALLATILYSVKAIFGPDISINEGFLRPIQIEAPEGCLVNAQEGAAVGGRTDTCQRVVDTIMGAMSHAVPEKIVAASNGATTAIIFGGTKNLTGKDFVYIEALGGGMGARFNKDGTDGVQAHITNTSNLPIEAMELEYPLRVLHYGLVPDSGGAGKFRGGLCIRKDIQALKPVLFSAHSDRHKIPPWGLNGGSPGARGKFILNPDTKHKKIIPSKISGVLINSDEIISIMTAGGGGFGSVLDRNLDDIARDIISGNITPEHAKEAYNIVLSKNSKVDWEATMNYRRKRSGD
jgi:N-methylhydantoinase B